MVAEMESEQTDELMGTVFLDPDQKSPRAQDFEERLSARIVGQERAVRRMSGLYQIFLAGMNPPNRPIGTMLFLGPTGSGKTRVIEAAAKTMRIVSTLDIWSYGKVTPELRTAADNLARFRAAGGTVVYGTDLGNGPIPPGIDVREVLLLHETVGMTPDEILEAMVVGPLQPGAPADLIAVARNPLEGLDGLGDLKLVVRAGRVVIGP